MDLDWYRTEDLDGTESHLGIVRAQLSFESVVDMRNRGEIHVPDRGQEGMGLSP